MRTLNPDSLRGDPRKIPDVSHYVECTAQGKVLYSRGQVSPEFPNQVNSFLELGAKLGDALRLPPPESIVLAKPGKDLVFLRSNYNNVGLAVTKAE